MLLSGEAKPVEERYGYVHSNRAVPTRQVIVADGSQSWNSWDGRTASESWDAFRAQNWLRLWALEDWLRGDLRGSLPFQPHQCFYPFTQAWTMCALAAAMIVFVSDTSCGSGFTVRIGESRPGSTKSGVKKPTSGQTESSAPVKRRRLEPWT